MNKLSFFLFVSFLLFSCSTSKEVASVEEVIEVMEPEVETEYRDLDTMIVTSEVPIEEEKEPYRATYSRDIDIIHTVLDVSFDWEKEKVLGKATLDIKPLFYPVRKFRLDAKGFDIHEIKLLPTNTTLDYTYDSTNLWITLNRQYSKEEAFKLYIDYTASPNETGGAAAIQSDKGLFFINPRGEDPLKPKQIWTQGETENNSKWFPTVDRPNERTTQEMYITVEDQYRTLSNGVLESSTKHANGTRTDHWVMDLPHAPYLFMIAVGDFAVVKDDWKGKELLYMVEPEYEEDAQYIFNHTPEMMTFFSDITGVEFPWSKYGQVVVRDYVSGAMENTTAVIFGEQVQRHKQDLMDEDNDFIVAHELFHHWFGDYVTCESWSNLTLNEGFANYSEYLWKEYKYGREKADLHLIEEFAGYLSSVAGGEMHPLIHFHYDDKDDMFDAHSYNKGGMVLHMLRNYLGDEAFFAGLKTYLEDNAFEAVEVHNLRLAFEKVTGMDLNWFFNQWFLSNGHPLLEVTHSYDPLKKMVTLQVDQIQSMIGVPAVFKLPAQLAIYDAQGNEHLYDVLIEEREQAIEIPLDFTPAVTNFDPYHVLLAEESEDHSAEDLKNLIKYSPSIIERIEALGFLDAEGELSLEIIENLLDDPSELLQAKAILSLSPEAALEAKDRILKSATTSGSPQLKAAAIAALTNMEANEVVPIASDILQRNEDSYVVIGSAFSALSELAPDKINDQAANLEKIKSASIVNALASYYVETKQSKDDYIINSLSNITGQQAWPYSTVLEAYIDEQPLDKRKELIDRLYDVGSTSTDPWQRLITGKVVASLASKYSLSDTPELGGELRSMVMDMVKNEPIDEVKGIIMQFLN